MAISLKLQCQVKELKLIRKKKPKKESPQSEFLRKKREEEWERLSKAWKKNEGKNGVLDGR